MTRMFRARTNTAVAFEAEVEPPAAVPAAWPTGLARLGTTVTACEQCEVVEACEDWRAAEGSPAEVPPFCPDPSNAAAAPSIADHVSRDRS